MFEVQDRVKVVLAKHLGKIPYIGKVGKVTALVGNGSYRVSFDTSVSCGFLFSQEELQKVA